MTVYKYKVEIQNVIINIAFYKIKLWCTIRSIASFLVELKIIFHVAPYRLLNAVVIRHAVYCHGSKLTILTVCQITTVRVILYRVNLVVLRQEQAQTIQTIAGSIHPD
jgi:hypothetical protein